MSWSTYKIWWRRMSTDQLPWKETEYSLKARTDDEAQKRLRAMFAGAGFTHMSLVAMPENKTPNSGLFLENKKNGNEAITYTGAPVS